MSSRSDLIPGREAELSAATAAAAPAVFAGLPASRRPDGALLTYYLLSSLVAGPFFMFILIPHYFKYRSLRYEVEEDGITMRWGVLFRKEISLTFARIQDIHLSSNFLERWLGLAKIQVQTASGSSSAEMTIEGLPDYEAVRDFLYTRMRGSQDRPQQQEAHSDLRLTGDPMAELAATLGEIASELRALRQTLPTTRGSDVDA